MGSTYLFSVGQFVHDPATGEVLDPFYLHSFDSGYFAMAVVHKFLLAIKLECRWDI